MILKLYTRRLRAAMPRRSQLCSAMYLLPILCLPFSGCASKPIATEFDGKWQKCEAAPQVVMMCLDEIDVGRLRKLLVQCGVKQ